MSLQGTCWESLLSFVVHPYRGQPIRKQTRRRPWAIMRSHVRATVANAMRAPAAAAVRHGRRCRGRTVYLNGVCLFTGYSRLARDTLAAQNFWCVFYATDSASATHIQTVNCKHQTVKNKNKLLVAFVFFRSPTTLRGAVVPAVSGFRVTTVCFFFILTLVLSPSSTVVSVVATRDRRGPLAPWAVRMYRWLSKRAAAAAVQNQSARAFRGPVNQSPRAGCNPSRIPSGASSPPQHQQCLSRRSRNASVTITTVSIKSSSTTVLI